MQAQQLSFLFSGHGFIIAMATLARTDTDARTMGCHCDGPDHVVLGRVVEGL